MKEVAKWSNIEDIKTCAVKKRKTAKKIYTRAKKNPPKFNCPVPFFFRWGLFRETANLNRFPLGELRFVVKSLAEVHHGLYCTSPSTRTRVLRKTVVAMDPGKSGNLTVRQSLELIVLQKSLLKMF